MHWSCSPMKKRWFRRWCWLPFTEDVIESIVKVKMTDSGESIPFTRQKSGILVKPPRRPLDTAPIARVYRIERKRGSARTGEERR